MTSMYRGEPAGEAEAVDPYDCAVCVARGDVCDFHRGWAAGWDDATEAMASTLEAEPVVLVDHYRDDASVVA